MPGRGRICLVVARMVVVVVSKNKVGRTALYSLYFIYVP